MKVDHAEVTALIQGLRDTPPRIPARYFYDGAGSRLFGRITRTPEYYPTRTELSILGQRGARISACVGKGVALIELGCGSADKALALLGHLPAPAVYRPIDISSDALERTSAAVRRKYPALPKELQRARASAAGSREREGQPRLVDFSDALERRVLGEADLERRDVEGEALERFASYRRREPLEVHVAVPDRGREPLSVEIGDEKELSSASVDPFELEPAITSHARQRTSRGPAHNRNRRGSWPSGCGRAASGIRPAACSAPRFLRQAWRRETPDRRAAAWRGYRVGAGALAS